jgi:SH3-like domain-containing protein
MSRSAIGRIGISLGVLAALAACEGRGGEGSDCPPGPKPKTPSGFCIPRYLSLRRGEVYGRRGPGLDYPVVTTYHARGLPVQVIDETGDWRRICDPDGGTAWVSRLMVEGRHTVMASGQTPVPLRAKPEDGGQVVAYLAPRATAVLGQGNGDWRQVSVDGQAGWVKTSEVWGLAPQTQCSLSPAAAPATGRAP